MLDTCLEMTRASTIVRVAQVSGFSNTEASCHFGEVEMRAALLKFWFAQGYYLQERIDYF